MNPNPEPVRWTDATGASQLRRGEVQVWRSPLERAGWLAGCRRLLESGEREKERAFLMDADRARYAAGRGLLRWKIGSETGDDPRKVVLHRNSRGKPMLGAHRGTLVFNVAHAGDMVLCAFFDGAGIGIDVEFEKDLESLHDIADRCFNEREREWLLAGHESGRLARFYWLWTRKEAVLKAHGGGLSVDPATVDVMSDTTMMSPGTRYALQSFVPAPGYVAALAVEGSPVQAVFLVPSDSAPDRSG